MSEKVKLTKAQAATLEHMLVDYNKENIVKWVSRESLTSDHPIYSIPYTILLEALYNGYEVEPTVDEQLLKLWCEMDYSENGIVFKQGMESVLNIIGMKVKGINA